MNWNYIKKLRMERLGFSIPAESEAEYDEIFKKLQPVSTEYFTEPGRPPAIRDRALFDDVDYNRLLRQNQDIIKARFQGNTISYVLREEFELYAAAFAKPISKVDDTMMELYTVLNQVGPMDKSQIMEELDLKGPVVTKILQKFQRAFMVYELQPDKFGEQVWQTFEGEWPEFDIEKLDAMYAKKLVVTRFIQNMVVADFNMIKDWSRFSNRDTKEIIAKLEENGIIETIGEGCERIWYLPEDMGSILNKMMVQPTLVITRVTSSVSGFVFRKPLISSVIALIMSSELRWLLSASTAFTLSLPNISPFSFSVSHTPSLPINTIRGS